MNLIDLINWMPSAQEVADFEKNYYQTQEGQQMRELLNTGTIVNTLPAAPAAPPPAAVNIDTINSWMPTPAEVASFQASYAQSNPVEATQLQELLNTGTISTLPPVDESGFWVGGSPEAQRAQLAAAAGNVATGTGNVRTGTAVSQESLGIKPRQEALSRMAEPAAATGTEIPSSPMARRRLRTAEGTGAVAANVALPFGQTASAPESASRVFIAPYLRTARNKPKTPTATRPNVAPSIVSPSTAALNSMTTRGY